MLNRFFVVALKLSGLVRLADSATGVRLGFDGVVCRNVRRRIGVSRGGMEFVQLGFKFRVATEDTFDAGVMRFPDCFAVPACTFRVDTVEHFLVCLAGPCESIRKLCLLDFVVMVDELLGSGERKGIVHWWG